MSLSFNKVPKWESSRRNFFSDLDEMYEQIKRTHRPWIDAGKLGYDDRNKMFHIAIVDGWNFLMVQSYNQNRLCAYIALMTGLPFATRCGGYYQRFNPNPNPGHPGQQGPPQNPGIIPNESPSDIPMLPNGDLL